MGTVGRTPISVAWIAFLSLVVSGCGTVGSGDVVTENRPVGAFDSLEISEGINVELLVDPGATPSVSVMFDDNLQGKVLTEVRGSTLVIEFDGSVSIVGSGRLVRVVVDALDSIEISGGANLDGTGTATSYRLSASGGANADLARLETGSVEVDVSGGADVRVYASESVEGEASGGANVTVVGDPDQARIDTSGGADVNFEG